MCIRDSIYPAAENDIAINHLTPVLFFFSGGVFDAPTYHAVGVRHSSAVVRGRDRRRRRQLDEDLRPQNPADVLGLSQPAPRRFKPDDLGFIVQLRRLPSTTCYINVHPDLITSPEHL